MQPKIPKSHKVLLPALLTCAFLMLYNPDGFAQQVGPIVIDHYIIDDDTADGSYGNSDGKTNAGEQLELPITLRNNGSLTAINVVGTLSTFDTYVTVSDMQENFFDIAAGDTASTEFDFDIAIDASTPPNHEIQLELEISADNGGPWDVNFSIIVDQIGPIVLTGLTIDDDYTGESVGNNDGEANAGEEIELTILLSNQGWATAMSVEATLSSFDSYVTTPASMAQFGEIAGGDTAMAVFHFGIDESAPAGYPIKFDLDISDDGGNQWIQRFDIPIAEAPFQQFTRDMTSIISEEEAGWSNGGSWGDFDQDGDQDLLVTRHRLFSPLGVIEGVNLFFENLGGGSFRRLSGDVASDVRVSGGSTWGDYDNDGGLDLFVANGIGPNVPGTNSLFHNNGHGVLAKISTGDIATEVWSSKGTSWGDYDNDGDLDLFVANSGGENNLLYQNNGDGSFTKITNGAVVNDGGNSIGCAWADYDDDGDLDLFVANTGSESNDLYENNGDKSFTRVTTGAIVEESPNSSGGSWGDYDNDGDLDLFVANASENTLYENMGSGDFIKITTGAIVNDVGGSRGSGWADYDNDGDLDLFVANGGTNFLYENAANGTFTKVTSGEIVSDGAASAGVSWADYDNDGDPDLFVANGNDQPDFLYRNNNNNGNHWINIHLVGTVSNTSAIGAKVRLKATIDGTPVWQLREISGQTGMYSQNSLDAHFGLGDAAIIDSIRIEWPSGIIENLTNVAPDQFLTAVESFPGLEPGIAIASGNNQTAEILTPTQNPLIVRVRDQGGTPVPGIKVVFKILAPPGTNGEALQPSIATTDSSGQAATTLTLGDKAGIYGIEAYPLGFPEIEVIFVATAESRGATTIALTSGNSQTSTVTQTLSSPFVVTVTDEGANPISGIPVTFMLTDTPSGATGQSLSATEVTSDANGRAQTVLTLGDKAGEYRVTASSTGLSGSPVNFTATALHGPPDTLLIASGDNQTGLIGGTLAGPFVVELRDAYGNPVTVLSQTVAGQWQIVGFPEGASGQELSVTDISNFAETSSTLLRLGNRPGQYVVAVSYSNLGPLQFIATAELPAYPETFNLDHTVVFPAPTSSSDLRATDYRLIGSPGAGNRVISDYLSGSQTQDWKVFWDNGMTSDYMVPFDGSSLFHLSVGRAFWVIHNGPVSLTGVEPSVPLNDSLEVAIPLHEGWNLITNPFNSAIPWSEIQSVNGITEPIFSYFGSFTDETTFSPFVGYYFFNETGTSQLRVPFLATFASDQAPIKSNLRGWLARVSLTVEGVGVEELEFGASPQATNMKDRFDLRKPRVATQSAVIAFERKDWDAGYSRFSRDVRAPFDQAQTWEFTVSLPQNNAATLTFSQLHTIPFDYDVYLIDEKRGLVQNIREDSSYAIDRQSSGFKLVVGESESVERELANIIPTEFALDQNYPNPFNAGTTIPVSMPVSAEAELKIYNVLGKLVKTLHEGPLTAGRHQIQWNGRDDDGREVSSGVYFVRLIAEDRVNFVNKMVALK